MFGKVLTGCVKGDGTVASAYCPDCDERIVLTAPRVGRKFPCPHCDTELEVISIDPLDLDWAYSYDEDWDEDEDEI
jgi:lysine biosynthesis protein LysW